MIRVDGIGKRAVAQVKPNFAERIAASTKRLFGKILGGHEAPCADSISDIATIRRGSVSSHAGMTESGIQSVKNPNEQRNIFEPPHDYHEYEALSDADADLCEITKTSITPPAGIGEARGYRFGDEVIDHWREPSNDVQPPNFSNAEEASSKETRRPDVIKETAERAAKLFAQQVEGADPAQVKEALLLGLHPTATREEIILAKN